MFDVANIVNITDLQRPPQALTLTDSLQASATIQNYDGHFTFQVCIYICIHRWMHVDICICKSYICMLQFEDNICPITVTPIDSFASISILILLHI